MGSLSSQKPHCLAQGPSVSECDVRLGLAIWIQERRVECREGDIPQCNTDVKDAVSPGDVRVEDGWGDAMEE